MGAAFQRSGRRLTPGRARAQVGEDLADAVAQVKALQEAFEKAHDSKDGAPADVAVPADVAALADFVPGRRRAAGAAPRPCARHAMPLHPGHFAAVKGLFNNKHQADPVVPTCTVTCCSS